MSPDGRAKLLIADDHPIYRDGLAAALAARPELEIAGVVSDGRAALEAIRGGGFEIALLDVRLPCLSGLQIANAVRREELDVRIVLISAFVTPTVVYEGIAAGATGFVSKDVDRDEIGDVLAAVARGEVRLPADVQAGLVEQIHLRRGSDRPVLTAREREVLVLIAGGKSAPDIGRELHLGTSTVKTHLLSLYGKLEVTDRAAAVAKAMRIGLLE